MITSLLQLTLDASPSTAGFGGVAAPIFSTPAFDLFFKILFVVAGLLYVAFAFVVTRQIKIMRTTLITTFSPVLRTIGYLHLILALLVLVFFILVL